MKLFLLLTFINISLIAASQETVNNFYLTGKNKIEWRKQLADSIKFNDVVNSVRKAGLLKNIDFDSTFIVGELDRLETDHKGAGFKGMKTPMFVSSSTSATMMIEKKEGYYIVTVKNIIVNDSFLGKTPIEEWAVGKDKKITPIFYKSPSVILDYTYNVAMSSMVDIN